MHIGPTRLLEIGPPNAKYDLKKRLRERYTSADWGDDGEIEEAIAADDNKDNDKENFGKKNRQLKKKKQCLKRAAAKARAFQQSD